MLKGRQAGFTVPFEQMENPWLRSRVEGPQSSPAFPLCSTQSPDPPSDKLSSDVLNPPPPCSATESSGMPPQRLIQLVGMDGGWALKRESYPGHILQMWWTQGKQGSLNHQPTQEPFRCSNHLSHQHCFNLGASEKWKVHLASGHLRSILSWAFNFSLRIWGSQFTPGTYLKGSKGLQPRPPMGSSVSRSSLLCHPATERGWGWEQQMNTYPQPGSVLSTWIPREHNWESHLLSFGLCF